MTTEDRRKAMHDSPEALSQWLRDIYTTGLQSNGILLVSGSVFADFMDAYERVVLRHNPRSVNRYLDDAVKGSMQRVEDVQRQVGFHHDNDVVDSTVEPTATYNSMSDSPDGQDDDDQTPTQTLDDAFGLSGADDSNNQVAGSDDGSQLSPGWQQPQAPVDTNDNNDVLDSSVNDAFSDDNESSGKVYEDSESEQAAQQSVGYANLDSSVTDSASMKEFNAGDTAERVMSGGTQSVLSSLESDLNPEDDLNESLDSSDDSMEPLAGSQNNSVVATHNDGSTSMQSNLFGDADDGQNTQTQTDAPVEDAGSVEPSASSDDIMNGLSELMGDGQDTNSDSGNNGNPPF